MNVHAATVITNHWFWHESRRFTVSVGNVMHNIFEDLHFVRFTNQSVEYCANLTLASSTYFVMMYFGFTTHVFHY